MGGHQKIVIASMDISAGGLGSYLMNMAEGLKERGWLVHIVASNSRDNLFDVMSGDFICHDLSTMSLSMRKVITASNLINAIAPDVLLLNHCSLMHYALPLIPSRTKPVAVLHSNDPRFYSVAAIFKERVFRWVAPTSGVALAATKLIGTANQSRISVIPHGVRTDVFNCLGRSPTPSGRIAFVGYVAENKGADLLPGIMQLVVSAHPTAHLSVVGYGPLLKILERQFRETGMEKNLTLAGALSPTEVAAVLRSSDIFLLPTRVEGFGLAIVEAMHCGAVPVVTHLSGVTDQIVNNGRSGFLVEQDKVEGFAGAVSTLLGDSKRLQELSDCASNEGKARFPLERMIADYENLFAASDNRIKSRQRTKMGWVAELLSEVMRKETFSALVQKGRYLFR